jgi:cytochrome P450
VDFISAFANPLPARVIATLIANGMLALLQNLEKVARLPDDYSFLPNAVEEFLPFQGPLQTVVLIAKENIEMAGVIIRADKKVFALVVASHRDQLIF